MKTQEFCEKDFKQSVIFDSVTLNRIPTPRLKWSSALLSKGSLCHFTCSAVIFDRSMEHVLLFAHKKYGFWVYPGGHAHSWDFRDEVLRELSEELGIRADHLISLTREAEGPAFLMKFYVSDGKCHSAEQEHVHFDAVFSYSLDSRARLMLNREEGLGYHWLPLRVLGQQETLAGLEIPKDTAFTIKKVMEQLSSF